jgi:hypothetical protein
MQGNFNQMLLMLDALPKRQVYRMIQPTYLTTPFTDSHQKPQRVTRRTSSPGLTAVPHQSLRNSQPVRGPPRPGPGSVLLIPTHGADLGRVSISVKIAARPENSLLRVVAESRPNVSIDRNEAFGQPGTGRTARSGLFRNVRAGTQAWRSGGRTPRSGRRDVTGKSPARKTLRTFRQRRLGAGNPDAVSWWSSARRGPGQTRRRALAGQAASRRGVAVARAEKSVLRRIIGFPRKRTLTASFDPYL